MAEVIVEVLLGQGEEEAVSGSDVRWVGGDGKQPADGRDSGEGVRGGDEGRDGGGGEAG